MKIFNLILEIIYAAITYCKSKQIANKAAKNQADRTKLMADPGSSWLRKFGGTDTRKNPSSSNNAGSSDN